MLDEDLYREYEPPMLYRLCTFKQPVNDISLEFWDHIVELF